MQSCCNSCSILIILIKYLKAHSSLKNIFCKWEYCIFIIIAKILDYINPKRANSVLSWPIGITSSCLYRWIALTTAQWTLAWMFQTEVSQEECKDFKFALAFQDECARTCCSCAMTSSWFFRVGHCSVYMGVTEECSWLLMFELYTRFRASKKWL